MPAAEWEAATPMIPFSRPGSRYGDCPDCGPECWCLLPGGPAGLAGGPDALLVEPERSSQRQDGSAPGHGAAVEEPRDGVRPQPGGLAPCGEASFHDHRAQQVAEGFGSRGASGHGPNV